MERRTRSYLQLIKPGITLSNTIAAAAGLLLGLSQASASWATAIALVVGTAMIIAASCVVNNVMDRRIDLQMKRTRRREIVAGTIPVTRALTFAGILGVAGFAALVVYTNLLTALIGVAAVIWYVLIYGYAKRHTAWSTIIGGVAGALPPMAGYTTVTGQIDMAAVLVFLILFFWQMPHFYAIAIFRRSDYAAASLPIWSVSRSVAGTKLQMLIFTILFALTGPFLTIFGYTGTVFIIGYMVLAGYWAIDGIVWYNKLSDEKWSKRMFGASILVLLVMCGLIGIGGYIP